MHLENLVFDALEPQRLGRFWEAAVGGERLTDEPGIFETRLTVEGGPVLDLCFQRVSQRSDSSSRIHLDLSGGPRHTERLLGLGARRLDPGEGDARSTLLADPEGNPCHVLDERAEHAGSGPLAAIPLDSADPERDAAFWSWLTGWTPVAGSVPWSLRHPSLLGPLLQLCPEQSPKGEDKNWLHLDVRLSVGDDADEVAGAIAARGGVRLLRPEWGELPWRTYADPSGNEFCVLPAAG